MLADGPAEAVPATEPQPIRLPATR
jgi:hypothetical protein